MDREEIRTKIKETAEVATISAVAFQTAQLLRNPDVAVNKITEIVGLDQSLTAKILRLVNSSFYGFQGKISSLSQAIVLLGFNTVRNVILSVSVLKSFSSDKGCKVFNAGKFWEHSVGTAFVAKNLAEHIKFKEPEDAFIGGLLHDVGRVFIVQFLRPEMEKIIDLMIKEDIPMREAEEKILDADHAWMGYVMAKNWHFPPVLCSAIGLHHAPNGQDEEFLLASIIHLADIICRGMDLGCGGDDFVPDVSPAAWRELSMSLEDVKVLIQKTGENLYQIEEFLAILRS
ncbi:MAG: HDOD domain-containing protein [Thermodesulfobacteriota bacterium]|nr:HDOD domain-containing protein [Thermodesulfobacteriota bacterium]